MVRDWENNVIYRHQENCVNKLLKRFNYTDLNAAKSPWLPKLILPKTWGPIQDQTKQY
jgi:hypothetical protein